MTTFPILLLSSAARTARSASAPVCTISLILFVERRGYSDITNGQVTATLSRFLIRSSVITLIGVRSSVSLSASVMILPMHLAAVVMVTSSLRSLVRWLTRSWRSINPAYLKDSLSRRNDKGPPAGGPFLVTFCNWK
jgi:hypothetical protein